MSRFILLSVLCCLQYFCSQSLTISGSLVIEKNESSIDCFIMVLYRLKDQAYVNADFRDSSCDIRITIPYYGMQTRSNCLSLSYCLNNSAVRIGWHKF